MLWTAFVFTVTGAPVCLSTHLQARLDADFAHVHGRITCVVGKDGPVSVATYPRILRRADSPGLTDINRIWFYPDGFSAADMSLSQGGKPLDSEGPWQDVGPARAGSSITLEFTTTIPQRYGTFGSRRNVVYLLGGWHPAFGAGGHLDAGNITYEIRLPGRYETFVGGEIFAPARAATHRGSHHGSFVPIMAAPHIDVQRLAKTTLLIPHNRGAPDIDAGLGASRTEEIFATLTAGDAFLANQGVAPPGNLVVLAPLREHLVEPFDGGLAVADRAFEVVPHEELRKFYRFAIWREQFATVIEPRTRDELVPPPRVVTDIIAVALRDRLVRARYGEPRFAAEVLEKVAVIPEIDALIFAPLVPFVDTFFNPMDETPLMRWRLDDFFHTLPRGKLLYEKLRDSLGDVAVQAAVTMYLRDPKTRFVDALRTVSDTDPVPLLTRWLGAYPVVNYGLEIRASDATRTRVAVTIDGPDAATLREPITVDVEDATGVHHRQRRDGPGELTFDVPGPARRVTLDPDGRLVELWHRPGYGSRFDNTLPHPWRFLLSEFSGLVAVTATQITLGVDFALRRLHDLTYSMDTYFLYSPQMLTAQLSGSYHFGTELTPLQRTQTFSLAAAFNRLRVESAATVPGNQLALTAAYAYENRLDRFSSFNGFAANASATVATGVGPGGEHNRFAQLGAGILGILPLHYRHALLGRLRGDIIFGNVPTQSALRLGGRYRGGRGFEIDEESGMRRILLSGEYRHMLSTDTRTDLWGTLLLHRLEGAFFADAVYLGDAQPGCGRTMFYDVGYSIRAILDLLNVSPAGIGLDFGFPLNRCADQASQHPPLTIYLGLVQSFYSF